MPAPSTCTVSGNIYGPNGSAVEGAKVKVYITTSFYDSNGNYIPEGLYASTATDSNGAWSLAVIRTATLNTSVTFQFEYPLGNNQSVSLKYPAVIPNSSTANFSALVDLSNSQALVTAAATTDNLTEGAVNLYFTDERAQDAVGGILTDSASIDFTYTDATPAITAIVIDDSISNAKLANVATQTIKGRTSASTGDPEDLTATQATAILNAMVGDSGSGGTKGLVPAPAAGDAAAGKFLKADGTFAVPTGTGDVVGPASATDNAIVRFDGTTGKLIQNSAVTVADTTGLISGAIFGNTGLNVQDTNASHNLNLKPGSDLTANRTLTLTTGDADRTLTLSADSTISGTNTGDQTITLTSDVTGSGTGSFATTIANDAVTNAKMADMAQSTIKGRAAGAGTGDPTDLTATQATAILDNMVGDSGAGGTKGLVPAPAAGDAAANKFLKADGSWATTSGGAGSTDSSTELTNLGLSASVASNALTIALKQSDGSTDPSTGDDAVKIGFRSSTATTGGYVQRSITSALSVVISSGSTLGSTDGDINWVYVYAIDNAGTVELAVSGTRINDEGTLINTTAEGGAGASDSKYAIYSTTARTGVACRLIGRVKSTQTTAGTWAASPSEVSVFPFDNKKNFDEVWLWGHNGYGSTNTSVSRFVTVGTNRSTSALTLTQSATNGDSVTVNEDGMYGMAAGCALTSTKGLTIMVNQTNSSAGNDGWYGGWSTASDDLTVVWSNFAYLTAGDIVRLNGLGAQSAGRDCFLRVVKLT